MTSSSLGATLNRRAQPVFGNEVILFRTRTEILTDQRIIVRGSTFPLSQITRVYVRPARYYVLFFLARLVLIGLAVLLLLSFAHVVGSDVLPGNRNFHLFAGVLIGLWVGMATWLVPTHELWFNTTSGSRCLVMRGENADDLRDVKVKIDAAARRRQIA